MKPSNFQETNLTLIRPASDIKKEIGDLRVFSDGQRCISLWKPTWRERLSMLVFGKVWLDLMSGKTQPPAGISGQRSYFESNYLEAL